MKKIETPYEKATRLTRYTQHVRKRMKKHSVITTSLQLLFVLILTGAALMPAASAGAATANADHPILYFFWGEGCPHCQKEKQFLRTLQERYPELEMRWFETWDHPQFKEMAEAMRNAFDITRASVPMTFIGDWHTVGYLSDDTTGLEIEEQIVECIRNGCVDALQKTGPRKIVWQIMQEARANNPQGWQLFPATVAPRTEQFAPVPEEKPTPPEKKPIRVPIPVIGTVEFNVSRIGLPLFTIIIGGLDGFNPCAIWVLCFLLTLMMYAKSRKKIFLIGGIFVITSGVIYFLSMTIWFEVLKQFINIHFLTLAVGIVAIVMGLINCKEFFYFKQGLFSLTIPESAQPKLFKRMRTVLNTTALPSMIAGTIVLAVTANMIELLCTAGFPMIFAKVLILQDVPEWQKYGYLVLYNVMYVVPLLIIVSIFGWKMGGRKLTEKEGRWLKLMSGGMMLALGIILVWKPDLLRF